MAEEWSDAECQKYKSDQALPVGPAPVWPDRETFFKSVLAPAFALVLLPLSFYTDGARMLPYEKRANAFRDVIVGWESLLHISIWPVISVAAGVAFVVAHFSNRESCARAASGCVPRSYSKSLWFARFCQMWPLGITGTAVLCTALFFSLGATIQSQVQVISPSMLWNPFLWGRYTVYEPGDISEALSDMCLDGVVANENNKHASPLCLPESSWDELSSGVLSSHNPDDVKAVQDGLKVSQSDSFGLAITILARDTVGSIDALQKNIEGLVPFVSKLSVVVFENDSKDGTRDAFKKWASEADDSYRVDIMDCEEAPECQFGLKHRYDGEESKDFFLSSAVGKMADFRQRVVDYVKTNEAYHDYSHILVMDVDLGVSLSPLGLIHALGKKSDVAVASSGRQPWPGSFGSLTPQYDFSAFRSIETPRNRRIIWLHQKFCELAPPGDRWRNICDCISPMMFMLVWGHDRGSGGEPFPVASAFNGAVVYPLSLIREADAKYDAGDDGQRCEHIGFNLSLKKPTYVDPKWSMNVKPSKLGGPSGSAAMMNILRVVVSPKISLTIFLSNFGCMVLFVYCVIVLSVHLLYPLWLKVLGGTQFNDAALFMDHRALHKSGSEMDVFIQRKRKVSDCRQLAKTV